MNDRLSDAARAAAPDLIEWRRYLHANPELSFEEHRTTEWLAQRMSEWKIPFTRPTPTGLVGVIEGNRPGRTVAVRADIDALPITEANGFAFRSGCPGVMHACGHDGHTAILLGLARHLSSHPDFPGRIKLLFQPAEEKPPGGAIGFVKAGVLDDVNACIGLHLMAHIPTGLAQCSGGPVTANSDGFTAVIQGRGGHGAVPHKAVDAVVVACNAVVNLQTVVSRKVDPTRPAVLTVGAIHAGTTFNVIADTAELKGTIRSYHEDVRRQLHDELDRTLQATCAMYGATVEVEHQWGYPATVNDPAVAGVLREAAAETLGAGNVSDQVPLMGGEDFAFYGGKVPAAFLFLGCRSEAAGSTWEHHHPRFTVDEEALARGMEILGRAALGLSESVYLS